MVEVKKAQMDSSMVPLEVGELPQTKNLLSLDINELPQAKKMELEDLEDLLQMIVSINNTDLSLYHLERNGKHIYLVWITLHDYYNLNGLPLVIFVRTTKKPARFIKYRPDLGEINFVEKVEEASAAYVKIVKIKQLPLCLDLAF